MSYDISPPLSDLLHSVVHPCCCKWSYFILFNGWVIFHCICVKVKSLSRVRLFVTPWTTAHQAPQSMGFSRQEYWSGLPFPSPGDLPDPGTEPGSPALEADALTSDHQGSPPFLWWWTFRLSPCLICCEVLQWILWCMYIFEPCFSLDKGPGVGLQGHMVALFLVFQETSIVFSTVAVPIYIPINSAGGFPSLHTERVFYLLFIWAEMGSSYNYITVELAFLINTM